METNMKRYYLDKIGYMDRADIYCNKDKRQKKWRKQRKKYGFDERETWSLYNSFYCWLYERLKLYKKLASKKIKLDFYKFEYKGKTYTQIQMINEMIKRLELYLSKDFNEYNQTHNALVTEIAEMWALVLPVMWW